MAEGFRKPQYPEMFLSKLADSDGEAAEAQVWLDFARDCGYMLTGRRDELTKGYEEVGKMLGAMMSMPEKFLPRHVGRNWVHLARCLPRSAFYHPQLAYAFLVSEA
jgi:hypothetical protein